MSAGSPTDPNVKLLPGAAGATPAGAPLIPNTPPPRQLSELPKDELEALAEDFGVDAARFPTRQQLVAAIHQRRQLVAALDRDALLDVVQWGRRPVPVNATREQLAQEIARIRLMKFAGLSHRGLLALAQLRGIPVRAEDDVPILVRKLKKQESWFSRLKRARRGMVASLVSRLIGERSGPTEGDYRFLPPSQQTSASPGNAAPAGGSANSRAASLREDIEESGLFGGLTNRIKKSADSYLNQKLDEIEARIDRKLDEIDRRLAEWRDKEIANRIRILKITLWASVIVGLFTLMYAYVRTYLPTLFGK